MKLACLVLLVVFLTFELHAQTYFLNSSNPNLNPLKIKNAENFAAKNDSSNFGENFPFQIGLEAGYFIPINKQLTSIKYGFIGYMDFNVLRRKIFIKLEIGTLFSDEEKKSVVYGSLGGNFRLFEDGHNRIFLNTGLGIHRKSYTLFPTGAIKYVFVINEFFGATASTKFIYPYKPFVALGIQFFNN